MSLRSLVRFSSLLTVGLGLRVAVKGRTPNAGAGPFLDSVQSSAAGVKNSPTPETSEPSETSSEKGYASSGSLPQTPRDRPAVGLLPESPTLLSLVAPQLSPKATERRIILSGTSLVGLFFAVRMYHLLDTESGIPRAEWPSIHSYDTARPWKKVVIRFPYVQALMMPEKLRRMIWDHDREVEITDDGVHVPQTDVPAGSSSSGQTSPMTSDVSCCGTGLKKFFGGRNPNTAGERRKRTVKTNFYHQLFEKKLVMKAVSKGNSDSSDTTVFEPKSSNIVGNEANFDFSIPEAEGRKYPDYPDLTLLSVFEFQERALEFLQAEYGDKFHHTILKTREEGENFKTSSYMKEHLEWEEAGNKESPGSRCVMGMVAASGMRAAGEIRKELLPRELQDQSQGDGLSHLTAIEQQRRAALLKDKTNYEKLIGAKSVGFMIQYDAETSVFMAPKPYSNITDKDAIPNRGLLTPAGVTYGHGNDGKNSCQLYIFPDCLLNGQSVMRRRLFPSEAERSDVEFEPEYKQFEAEWNSCPGLVKHLEKVLGCKAPGPKEMLYRVLRMGESTANNYTSGLRESRLRKLQHIRLNNNESDAEKAEIDEEKEILYQYVFGGRAFSQFGIAGNTEVGLVGSDSDQEVQDSDFEFDLVDCEKDLMLRSIIDKFHSLLLQATRNTLYQALVGADSLHRIMSPNEAKRATLFTAERGDKYYYTEAGGVIRDIQLPMVFLGDAMGGTDYQLGMSGGRGCFCANDFAQQIVDKLKFDVVTTQTGREPSDRDLFRAAQLAHTSFWQDEILKKEFLRQLFYGDLEGKPVLLALPDVFYRYMMEGREESSLVFEDGEKVSREALWEFTKKSCCGVKGEYAGVKPFKTLPKEKIINLV